VKNLHPDTLAKLKGDHLRAILVTLDFTPTPVYLANTPFDVNDNGITYLANGKLLKVGSVAQTMDIRVGSTNIEFDAVDPSLVAILRTQSQNNRAVKIALAILNDDYSVAGTPIIMQSMIIDGSPKITDDPLKGKAIIQQKISSAFANWSQKSGRRTTPASQQRFFPNDTGFDFAPISSDDVKWGRK
tara:strand:+ start:1533 stop:2093 length:561 start_codon:yes stop_codon:yes gene_type:complete